MDNKKPTIYEVAAALGVSVRTVNRALHNQPRISPETRQRVLDKAKEMGFKASQTAQSLRRKPIRIGVVMYCPVMQYLLEIQRGMEAAFKQLNEFNVYAEYHIINEPALKDCRQSAMVLLQSFAEEKNDPLDGLVLFASGENACFVPAIERLEQVGIPVATVANDVVGSTRKFAVCGEGACAGSLAAELLYRCSARRIAAILIGGLDVEIHKENVRGFHEFARRHPFQAIGIYQHQDNPGQLRDTARKMFREHPDLDGIYITSAIAPLACKAIEEVQPGHSLNIITTDLFEETRRMLREERIYATIFQDPYGQGKQVIKKMYKYICGESVGQRYNILPQIIFSSNCNQYLPDAEQDE